MYNKNSAVMTKGFAILCMLVLHLFNRTGGEVFGNPLIWVTDEKPLVYIFGFFANICVPLYSICAGYAQYLIYEKNKYSFSNNLKRIFKILLNYWIILFIFCLLGLIFKDETVPGSMLNFIKSIFLFHSYNGAWWFLNTYVILLLIPACVIFFCVKKIKSPFIAFSMCFTINIVWYLLDRFEIIMDFDKNTSVLSFAAVELLNLINVLPYFWIGCFMCKFETMDHIKKWLDKYVLFKYQKPLLITALIFVFATSVVIHKTVLMGFVAMACFVIFNLLKKSKLSEKVFLFLGKHSTNIWLTHMFFYSVLFVGLVEIVKYPLFMLLLMLFLCVITSYMVIGIQTLIFKIINSKDNTNEN